MRTQSLNRRVSLGLLVFILGVFPAEGAGPGVVTIESTNGIVLSFPTDAILEEATEASGLWLTVPGAANPYSVPLPLESRKFFRVRMPGYSIRSETNPANGHVYHLIAGTTGQQGISWTEAETTANALGGHLASVNDAAENSWITTTFPEVSYFWIGLDDVETEGVFAWSNRQPVSFLNWFPGEPNDTGGVEDYVLIYNFDSGFRQWNDNANTREFSGFPIYAVAEIDPFTLDPEGGNYSTRFQRAVWASNRDGSYEIWMLDLAQTNFVQLTTNSVPTVNQHPVFTHDGSRIVFERDEDLYIMDVTGANVQRLTFDGYSSHPWASFDGRIFFTRMVSGAHTLWRMELDSTNPPEQLTQPDAERFHGNLRCDGKLLLYTFSPLGTSTPTAICILNLQSGEDEALYSPGWPVSAAIWHPGGHKAILAEDHDGDGAYRLVEVGYPGGAVLNDTLTTDAASHTIPYYSYPDGQDIDWVLQPDAGRSRDIWRMNSDGSNQENLSRHPLEDTKIVGYPTGTDSEGRCIRPPVGCNPTPPPCDLLLPAGPREDAEDLGREFQRRDLLAGGLDDVRFADFQTFTETRLQEALGLPDLEPSLRDAASRLLELWLNDPTPGRREEIAYVFVNSYLNDYPAITGPITSTNDVYFAGTALVLISTVPPELGSGAIVHFDVAGTSSQVTADDAGLYTIVLEVPTNSTETPISTYAIAGDGSRQTPVSQLRAMLYPTPSFGFALPRNLATEAAPATMGGVRPANGIISVQPNPCTCIECGGGTALGIFSPAAFNASYATVDHGVELVTSRLLHTFDIASFSTRGATVSRSKFTTPHGRPTPVPSARPSRTASTWASCNAARPWRSFGPPICASSRSTLKTESIGRFRMGSSPR